MKRYVVDRVVVLIAGVGYSRAKREYVKGNSSELIDIDGVDHKLNIGAAIAKRLAGVGMEIYMLARRKQALLRIKDYIQRETNCAEEKLLCRDIDLTQKEHVNELISGISSNKSVWLVHSIGLSSRAYALRSRNPYLPIKEIDSDEVIKEFEIPIRSLLNLIQCLGARITKQLETRIVIITSMSGIRPYAYGFSHAAAKSGLHQAVRSLSLEMSRNRSVYVTEILPGIVDTGLYDNRKIRKAVQLIGTTFGYYGEKMYRSDNLPLMPPSAVAEAVELALFSKAHILSINMVAQGQFVNMG